ncbi:MULTISPECIES: hypothetical protein [unclassified Actinomyces]|uniref:hypothetical protein n=1 Tax=unclassified Actinomyces TaxID=2609248 RepID=UPI0011BD9C69|nr:MULTISPECIES: hypothetical protein [unclassified Actinomyces]
MSGENVLVSPKTTSHTRTRPPHNNPRARTTTPTNTKNWVNFMWFLWPAFVAVGETMRASWAAVLLLGAAILAGCSGPDLSGDAEEIAKNVQAQVSSAQTVERSDVDDESLLYQYEMREWVRSVAVIYDSQYECVNGLEYDRRCRVVVEEFDTEDHAEQRARYLNGYSSANPPDIVVPHVLGRYVVWFQDEMPEDVRQDYLDALR